MRDRRLNGDPFGDDPLFDFDLYDEAKHQQLLYARTLLDALSGNVKPMRQHVRDSEVIPEDLEEE